MDRARSSDQRELLIFFLILEVEPWQEVGTGAYKAEMDHLLRDRILSLPSALQSAFATYRRTKVLCILLVGIK